MDDQRLRTAYIGVDLGQSRDYTALSVLETVPPVETTAKHYALRYLERVPLGTPYPAVVEQVARMRRHLGRGTQVVVDATGVGRPVVDLFRIARLSPIAITITGGDTVGQRSGSGYTVPKRDLVFTLLALLQTERLKIAEGVPFADTLTSELANFKVKLNAETGHDQYLAWREGVHDDLVLSVALASWYAERPKGGGGALATFRDDPPSRDPLVRDVLTHWR